jgi:hypothetical protein
MIDQRGLGTRIISIDEHGKSTVKNAITSDKRIGEIQLVKQEGDYICNLCRNPVAKCFSEDHVPPQSMGNKGEFHYINYLNFCTRVDDYYGLFRSGIKYKTVCDKCNMEVLSPYDQTIGAFASKLTTLLENGDTIINITCNPHHVLKGLIGHCLSASLTSNPSAMEMQMLAYFWGNSKFQDCIRPESVR